MKVRRRRQEMGQQLVEYALTLPLLFLMVLGIIEFGIIVFSYDSIANAAREGARYGIIHPEDNTGIEAAARASTLGLDQSALTVLTTRPDEDLIRVQIIYVHSLLTAAIVEVVGGTSTVQLQTLATMTIE